MIPCHFCKTKVDPLNPQVWQAVVGWERKAQASSRRGGSDIVLRQPREYFACDTCIGRKRRGLSPTQEAML